MSSFVPVKSRQGSKVFHEDVDRYKSIEIGLIDLRNPSIFSTLSFASP